MGEGEGGWVCGYKAFISAQFFYISVRRDYSCGSAQYYNSSSGTIKSHGGYDAGHNYGKNMHCTWRIEAPPGWKVLLTAEAFDVQLRSK